MKTIRIQNNWLVKAIKSGVLNVSDIPYKSWDEKAKIDAIISKINVYWKDASKSLLSNMIIPSEKYIDAVSESIPSFIKSGILSENIENERVCLLVDSENIKGSSFCIFYPKYNSYLLYVFKEEYFLMMMIKDDYISDILLSSYSDESHSCYYSYSDTEYSVLLMFVCNMFSLFEKYAQIETKTIAQGKKLTTSKARIKNESIAPFKYRTSRYYTSCIRNDNFKVRGHMRFQPCKDENGDWTHKLIYIKEFLKHGYHRSAELEKKVS